MRIPTRHRTLRAGKIYRERRAELDRRKTRRKQFADEKVRMPGRYVRARSIARAEGAKERRRVWDFGQAGRIRRHVHLWGIREQTRRLARGSVT